MDQSQPALRFAQGVHLAAACVRLLPLAALYAAMAGCAAPDGNTGGHVASISPLAPPDSRGGGAVLLSSQAIPPAGEQPGEPYIQPRLLRSVAPTVPEQMRQQRLEGDVVAVMHINRLGQVSQVEILKSPAPMLSDSVSSALKRWVYAPMVRNGATVPFQVRQSYHFRLGPS
jgi:TonB family protein